MSWFLVAVDALSAIFLLVAALLMFLYAREFFMDRPPREWYVVGAGFILVALASSIGFHRFNGILRIAVAVAVLTGTVILTYGFFRAYSRSTGGMR